MSNKHKNLDQDISTWRTFLKLWPYITQHKFVLFISIMLLIVSAFADTSLIGLLRPLLDLGFSMNDQEFLWRLYIYLD